MDSFSILCTGLRGEPGSCRLVMLNSRGSADLVELVLLAQLHTLLPAVVALEEVGGDSPELDQLVLLQALGE